MCERLVFPEHALVIGGRSVHARDVGDLRPLPKKQRLRRDLVGPGDPARPEDDDRFVSRHWESRYIYGKPNDPPGPPQELKVQVPGIMHAKLHGLKRLTGKPIYLAAAEAVEAYIKANEHLLPKGYQA